jgi:solute carrier family 25 carnitine/acylcarnitine transporter 20/29
MTRLALALKVLFLVVLAPVQTSAFANFKKSSKRAFQQNSLNVFDPGLSSVLAGSLAGAVGVGLAYPLDTIKTKSQLYSQEQRQRQAADALEFSAVPLSVATATFEDVITTATTASSKAKGLSMLSTAKIVFEKDGFKGFFAGVKGVMAGEAVIKAIAFSANAKACAVLQDYLPAEQHMIALLTAACLSGVATSFLVSPVERVKVMMQASPEEYDSEWKCLQAIVANEGLKGLFSRGLGPTLMRDVPGYGLYFGIYAILSQSIDLGPISPLVFGATAGSASWIPVYPIDVVKTLMQNTAGDEAAMASTWQVMRTIYAQGGITAFFEGMTPKVLRAAVNHAATFTIYDSIMHSVVQNQ